MSDQTIQSTYSDLLDEADDPALRAAIQAMEQVYPRVQPPAGLMDRIRASQATASYPSTAATRPRGIGTPFLAAAHPVRRSVALAAAVVLAVSLLGGAGYAMRLLGGPARAHVVQSCSGFGTHWQLAGVGVRMMSPQQFTASGGRLIPAWQRSIANLQRPEFWVTPSDADIVDTCRYSSSNQVEIGRNERLHTQLEAISVVPLWQSNRPTMVGTLLIPAWGGCTPVPTTSPVRAPDGRPVAQLARVPTTLSRSQRVTFTPCNPSRRRSRIPSGQPPASEQVGFHILSEVQYRGSMGAVVIVTARPTPAAARPGLDLGAPAGTLPDGARVWGILCSRLCRRLHAATHTPWTNDLRWVSRGLIIDVSGALSTNRLKMLAADVVVK